LQGLLTFRGDGTRTNTGFGSFEQRQLDGKEMVAEMNTVSEISEFK
jgi:CRISPR/Cas system CMR-associated protein Cmr1 (group 7 of RAMP superfamily)